MRIVLRRARRGWLRAKATSDGVGSRCALGSLGEVDLRLAGLFHLIHAVLRVEASLNALCQGDLLLSVKEGDLTDLLEVSADRVRYPAPGAQGCTADRIC